MNHSNRHFFIYRNTAFAMEVSPMITNGTLEGVRPFAASGLVGFADVVAWLWSCILSNAAAISGISGYLSMFLWLFAQIPQVIKVYEEKTVDGLSWQFLACWYGGDLLNFASCLLNDTMMFQVLLSGYYCIIDLILAGQFYYYSQMYHNPESKWHHRGKRSYQLRSPKTSLRTNLERHDQHLLEQQQRKQQNPIALNIVRSSSFAGKLISTSFIAAFGKVQALPIAQNVDTPPVDNSVVHRLLVFLCNMSVGQMMAWCCTALYLGSRIPQLLVNQKKRSTHGVSMQLISLALAGNLTYSISLVFNENSLAGGEISRLFWQSQLSYFVGACGTVAFDFIAILQWLHFDHNRNHVPDLQHLAKSEDLDANTAPISINFSNGISSSHVKKLSESTPLSPMDFLEEKQSKVSVRSYSSIQSPDTLLGSSFKIHPSQATVILSPPRQFHHHLHHHHQQYSSSYPKNSYTKPADMSSANLDCIFHSDL